MNTAIRNVQYEINFAFSLHIEKINIRIASLKFFMNSVLCLELDTNKKFSVIILIMNRTGFHY